MKPVYLSILQKETGTRIKTGNSLPTLDNFVILSRILNTRIEDILVIDEDIVFYLL